MTSPAPPDYDGTEQSWTRVNDWAMCNNSLWNRVARSAQIAKLTHDQRLKMLAHALLVQDVRTTNEAISRLLKSPVPFGLVIEEDKP